MNNKFPVVIRTLSYSIQNINFYYPAVYIPNNSYIQGLINFTIYENMLRLSKNLMVPDIPTYVTGSYELKNNQKGVLTLSLIGFAEFGGAHPMTMVKSLNFDLSTGKDIPFYELFKPNSPYIEVLSGMVLEELKKQDIMLFEDYPGVRPDQDYYIADKALVIYFQLYDIAPYVVGFPYAVIPIYSIIDLVQEGGLLDKMVS
ncbi:DUF3298 and DUF4163 domain-containing protein [Alkalibaculum bacchi]|uniref:DUF3298 and DUF4163 domain-containing protein n=1 Tax=Alkalibaculum bacchi TaxID=645887 RepID=UPI0026F0ACA7|nr:DUF3298 and DUF4163 domain-containing protein [Alkalibaculum bacchi]